MLLSLLLTVVFFVLGIYDVRFFYRESMSGIIIFSTLMGVATSGILSLFLSYVEKLITKSTDLNYISVYDNSERLSLRFEESKVSIAVRLYDEENDFTKMMYSIHEPVFSNTTLVPLTHDNDAYFVTYKTSYRYPFFSRLLFKPYRWKDEYELHISQREIDHLNDPTKYVGEENEMVRYYDINPYEPIP